MFCQKCGKENPDTNQFCGDCGEPLKKIIQDNTQKKTTYKPSVVLILMGLFIISAIYLLPISSVPFGGTITLAKQVELCSAPFSSLLYRCSDSL